MVEIYCYYHMRTKENPPDTDPPVNLNYDLWTGPAPLRPYNKLVHPRSWRAFMEYGNGIVGDMCVHMLDMVRWMMNLGWPTSVSSSGGILVDKASKANISDTQTATFNFPQAPVIWQHRTWGELPPGFAYAGEKELKPGSLAHPRYPWGATFYGDKGTLECSVMDYTFTPTGGSPIHKDVVYELEQFPEDKTEKDLEQHVAPAIRAHMKNLLQCIASRGKPVADIEQGYISTASCILANMSMQLGRSLAWDVKAGRIANDDEANKLLKRSYRGPWVHPG
jgi:predicted dehydrogenase